jgi:DGQHR domain-containing protein
METKSYPYLAIEQPVGTFYLAVVGAVELLQSVDILRRGLSAEERENVQRKLNDRRTKEIASFLEDPDATFPTSIIISVYPEALEKIDETERTFEFRKGVMIGEVIDGQHRLEGIRRCVESGESKLLDGFQLPVVFMLDLAPEDKAYIFSIINSKQTPVSSSLIFDLFGLRQTRSPRKTCHDIAEAFNADPKGPFFRGIKMLGNKVHDSEILTQGAFVKYTLQLVTKTADDDERREKKRDDLEPDDSIPLRSLYLQGKDEVIGKILQNYFSAIRAAFPKEWEGDPKRYLLRKTAGFSALITAFKTIWPRIRDAKDATTTAFAAEAEGMRLHAGNYPLTSEIFGSSEQGAKKLANLLIDGTPPPTQNAKPSPDAPLRVS